MNEVRANNTSMLQIVDDYIFVMMTRTILLVHAFF